MEDDVSVGVESVVSQRDKSEKVSLDLEWMECFQEIRDYYFKRVQEMEEDDEERESLGCFSIDTNNIVTGS